MAGGLLRGISVPNFAENPADLIELGVDAERAGFDGFFLWDHIVFTDTGDGPPIADPWQVLAGVAIRTSRIRIGTMITPVPRRRPWQLARQTATLDVLSGGRLTLGVGLGSPAYGDFGIFHEPAGDRERAELLDEGLTIMAGLWSGEPFSYAGQHYAVDTVTFRPRPVQRPRIPVWVGGILPAARPVQRAARWDGMVPIRYDGHRLAMVSPHDIAGVRAQFAASRPLDGADFVVWADVADDPRAVPQLIAPYREAGATWWLESSRPDEPDWWERIRHRVAAGV
ncbi:MAG: LLM class flavin-dependent oxidoreductase [Streptosporangiaceae bacterium]